MRRSRSRNPLAQHAPHHLTADDARFGRGRSVFPVLDVQFTIHQDILLVLLGTDLNATHKVIWTSYGEHCHDEEEAGCFPRKHLTILVLVWDLVASN